MNLDRIIEEFEAEHLLYTKEYYKELDQDEHADVEQILCKIGKKIESNEKTQIYNDQIRNNLYNILSVIRNKTEDIKIKEEVNRLITILNKTDKYNADEYMTVPPSLATFLTGNIKSITTKIITNSHHFFFIHITSYIRIQKSQPLLPSF